MPATLDPPDTLTSFHAADKATAEPLIRVMALHALAYCERLFYLEEVEEIRRADANVYDGRRLHEEWSPEPEAVSLELASEILGIKGKLDGLREQRGNWLVVEHKKGRSHQGQAWASDRLQVLAYALLLAEEVGQPVRQAVIHYHGDNKRVKLTIDPEAARQEVLATVARARQLRESLERPPVTVSETLCRTCSLAPECLPQEEIFAQTGTGRPPRLFPADDDRQIVHLVEQGLSVKREGEQLVVIFPDGRKKTLPGLNVAALVLHGNIQISTQALHFCAAREIGVHWLTYGGHYVGALSPGAGQVQRRHRQFRALTDPTLAGLLAGRLLAAKIDNQLRYLQRTARGQPELAAAASWQEGLAALRAALQEVQTLTNQAAQDSEKPGDIRDCLRGHEGQAGRVYFSLWPLLLKQPPDSLLAFQGRNRRPPQDPVNALLSFGYALLYRDCVAALQAVGLEPACGFLHTPRSAAYPLAMDLMELFRLLLWDIPLLGSINRRQWQAEDFDLLPQRVWLSQNGRRKAIQLYENRKQEKWKHPVLSYSLSYARTIELEARLLEKEWTGQPGLFATLRLR